MNNKNENIGWKQLLLGHSTKHGTLAAGIAVLVIALTVILNLIVSQLPSDVLEVDVSSQKIYDISEVSKEFVKNMDAEIELIMIHEPGTNATRIEKFVYDYAAMSDSISARVVDPVLEPSILTQYDTAAGSLIVLNKETGKYKEIPYGATASALIIYGVDTQTQEYYESEFDADGQITSAINYVVNDSDASIYMLGSHGESDLPSNALARVNKANLLVKEDKVDILLGAGIPEDCDLLICNNPTSDLADDELDIILDYMDNGGKFYLIIDETNLPNFNKLLRTYGLEMQEGYLGDQQNYYQQYAPMYQYFCFAPELNRSSAVTSSVSAVELVNALVIQPRGMTQVEPARGTIELVPFMSTSEQGIRKTDNDTTESGQYIIGAVAKEQVGADGETAQLTVIAATTLINDSITTGYTNTSNLDIFMNAITDNLEDYEGISIPSKSLIVTYNTFDNYQIISLVIICGIPALLLLGGFFFWFRRRKR